MKKFLALFTLLALFSAELIIAKETAPACPAPSNMGRGKVDPSKGADSDSAKKPASGEQSGEEAAEDDG